MKTFKQFSESVYVSPASRKVENPALRKVLSSHYKGFTPPQREAIRQYTGEAALNDYIHTQIHRDPPRDRRTVQYDDEKRSAYASHVGHLDTALDKHETPQDMHVFAAVRFDPRTLPNNEYHSKGYFSSSISYNQARRFSSGAYTGERPTQHIVKIKVPSGSKGAYVRKYSDPEFAHQEEFILPRDSRLRYTGRSYAHEGKMIHECELVGNAVKEEAFGSSHIHIHNLNHRFIYELS